MLDKCIVCDSVDNLNTSMNFTIDGKDYGVVLCDDHAEDTTPKAAKACLNKRLDIIKDFMEQAAALGLQVVEPGSDSNISVVQGQFVCECGKVCASKGGLTTHRKSCKVQQPSQAQAQTQRPQIIIPPTKEEIEQQDQRRVDHTNLPSASGQVDGGSANLEGYQTIHVDSEIDKEISALQEAGVNTVRPEQIVTEVQEVAGRGGQKIVLPKETQGNMGTTKIKVEDTGGDRALQDRFKAMAGESTSVDPQIWKNKSSYDKISEVPCALCRGTGTTRIGNKTCPKCDGSGLFETDVT